MSPINDGFNSQGVALIQAKAYFDKCFIEGEELTEEIVEGIDRALTQDPSVWLFTPEKARPVYPDVASAFYRGHEIFSSLKDDFPLTYDVLADKGGRLHVGSKDIETSSGMKTKNLYLFLEVQGRCVFLQCQPKGLTLAQGSDADGWLLGLPKPIRNAFFWSIDGWFLPTALPPSPMLQYQLLGSPRGTWKLLEDVFNSISLDVVSRMNHSHSDKENYRIILDTRPPPLIEREGQVLIADISSGQEDSASSKIWVSSTQNLVPLVLQDPVGALDQYYAHTLDRSADKFEFMDFV